jgi:hypothetical protein
MVKPFGCGFTGVGHELSFVGPYSSTSCRQWLYLLLKSGREMILLIDVRSFPLFKQ